ncbi:hypothetical protein IQ255_16020 [Pleurocapsales cyanobacterium LEGE 10410]|nr:hypothetical protein [Pleurocapsales cyanobacterium LEGE 10410]
MYLHDCGQLAGKIYLSIVNAVVIPHIKMNLITKLTLTLTAALAQLNGVIAISSPTVAQEIDRNTLCHKFPLNFRCEDFEASKSTSQTYQLDRDSFCDKFPLNSQCQQPPLQVIKLNLDRSGEDDEWVQLEKRAGKIKLQHTTRVKDGLASGVLNGALGLVPFPLPFIEANKYNWKDHRVTGVSFKGDRCKTESCVITGKDTLVLPEDTNVSSGLFTIDYREKDLRRSLSFRIPEDTKVETIETITVETGGH